MTCMDQCHATVMAARKRSIRRPLFGLLLDSIMFISDLLLACVDFKMTLNVTRDHRQWPYRPYISWLVLRITTSLSHRFPYIMLHSTGLQRSTGTYFTTRERAHWNAALGLNLEVFLQHRAMLVVQCRCAACRPLRAAVHETTGVIHSDIANLSMKLNLM